MRFVPSGRSLLVVFVTVVAVGVAYLIAYASPVFAVEKVVVRGASPELSREVARATRELVGQSLVAVDAEQVEGSLRALPEVAGVSVDRAFPDKLVIRVAPERGVAVVRSGRSAWLVTGAGKVIRELEVGTRRHLPRLWLTRGATIRLGGQIPAGLIVATRALAAAHSVGLGGRVKAVRLSGDELTLVLRRGLELRLGRTADVGMKLAIARDVLALVDSATSYVDVSVPQRPVAG